MRTLKTFVGAIALAAAGLVHATPVLPGSEQSLQSIINGLYTAAGTNPALAPDVNADQLDGDGLWSIQASGGSIATFIIEITANAGNNSFGIFDAADPSRMVQLFGNSAPGGQTLVSIKDDGSVFVNLVDTGIDFAGNVFGYYLTAGNTTWLSTNEDQMVAFRGDGDTIKLPTVQPGEWGSSSYILAWEDILYANSDKDFNDFVVYVESVSPVPAPATLALMGLGLLGLGFKRRRA
ncbi:MAG: DUF4114 domain-containing protein [Burkholderiaceae bacterium]